jgi:hypothetical protein
VYIIEEIETWYHGSEKEIRNWSTEFVGKGADQEGAGIYFTSNLEDAEGYKKTGSGVVHIVTLNTSKWLSTTKKPVKAELEKLIQWAEDYETTLSNWGNENPVADLRDALHDYMQYNKTNFEAIKAIEADFYQGDAINYCSSLVALGYDGVQVKKSFMNTIHAIVWNPKIIKIQEVI